MEVTDRMEGPSCTDDHSEQSDGPGHTVVQQGSDLHMSSPRKQELGNQKGLDSTDEKIKPLWWGQTKAEFLTKSSLSKTTQGNGKIQLLLMARIKEFLTKSSLSKTAYNFRDKSVTWLERIIWLGILIVIVMGFAITIGQLFKNKIKDEPVSTIINDRRNQFIEFPAVTICSLSLLDTMRLNKTLNLGYTGLNDFGTLFDSVHLEKPPNMTQCLSAADKIAMNYNYINGYGTLVTKIGPIDSPEELINRCSFHREDCKSSFTQIPTVGGMCFTFNSSKAVPGSGSRYGLGLVLPNGDQLFSLNLNFGYSVIIHNQDEPPRPESQGVVVGRDSTLYVGLKRIETIDATEYSQTAFSGQRCNTGAVLNFSIPSYPFYSPPLCLNDCLYSHVAAECNCVERQLYTPVRPPYTEMRDCNVRDICCEVVAFNTFTESTECDCPPSCRTVEWQLITSSATAGYVGSGVFVYFDTLITETRRITDSYTEWSLISAMGGTLGLFLGVAPFFLIGELLFLGIGLIATCCRFYMDKKGFTLA